jgi:hypothetical protein
MLFWEQVFVRLRHKFLYHKIPKQVCIFFNIKSIEDYYKEMGRAHWDKKGEEEIVRRMIFSRMIKEKKRFSHR